MRFDELVNKLLGEAISAIPKTSTPPNAIPKKISDIGTTPTPIQQQAQGQVQQQQPAKQDASAVDALTKQIADAKKADDERAKKEHDDFAKLIATMTASVAKQQPLQPQNTTPQTNIPQSTINPQDVIANLKKM